jgi:uncharacterized DUF497 family protein
MSNIRFAWHPAKASANRRKHGVSFEEAQSVFYDERAKLIADPEHSRDEERFVLLGMSERLRVLVVVHAYRSNDEVIRIISARKATSTEQRAYWEQR